MPSRLSLIKQRIIHNGTPPDEVSSPNLDGGIESVTTEEELQVSPKDIRYPAKLEETFQDGKYLIKGHLGSGRYSSVWLAEDFEYVFRTSRDDPKGYMLLEWIVRSCC